MQKQRGEDSSERCGSASFTRCKQVVVIDSAVSTSGSSSLTPDSVGKLSMVRCIGCELLDGSHFPIGAEIPQFFSSFRDSESLSGRTLELELCAESGNPGVGLRFTAWLEESLCDLVRSESFSRSLEPVVPPRALDVLRGSAVSGLPTVSIAKSLYLPMGLVCPPGDGRVNNVTWL